MTETIDITPTWQACVKIYIAVLESKNASFTGKREARTELLRLAKIVDDQNDRIRQIGKGKRHDQSGTSNRL
jgi:hypothetical protein